MANIIADRVRETTSSTGTTTLALAGAMIGFRSFGSVMAIGDTCYACIVAVDSLGAPTGQWEVGQYTYTAANTLTRTAVLSSSANNQLVNFGEGVKHVFLDLTAYQVNAFAQPTAPGGGGTGTGGGTDLASIFPYQQDASLYYPLTEYGFYDNFPGTALDTTKWTDRMWFRNATQQDSLPKNYAVQNNTLYIWPQQWGGSGDAPGFTGFNGFYERELSTHGKFSQQFGFFECYAKIPVGRGLFPSFWLYNHTDTTVNTEIDIFEMYPGAYDGNVAVFDYANSSLHATDYDFTVYNNSAPGYISRAGTNRAVGGPHSNFPSKDLSTTFNYYGVKWDSNGITPYFNGQPLGVVANIDGTYAQTLAASKYTASNYATRPMYLIFSLWLMKYALGNESYLVNVSETPVGQSNSLEIKYAAAWKLRNP